MDVMARPMTTARCAAVLTVALALGLLAACGNPVEQATQATQAPERPAAAAEPVAVAVEKVVPPFAVAGDCDGLLLSWFDGDGLHTAQRRQDVPEDRRAQVRVVSMATDPTHRLDPEHVYVADLTAPGEGGAFPVVKMPRAAFDALVDAQTAAARPADAEVVLYSASWCGVCKATRRFLEQQGVAFTEKDVEKDPGANAEMQRKARAAGKTPRGVPVIDFGGEIILGFDQGRLRQLIDGR